MSKEQFEKVDLSYDEVAWYRKRWFLFVTFLLFMPATVVIALTGDVYMKKDDEVYKFSERQRWMIVAVVGVLFVVNFIRLSA